MDDLLSPEFRSLSARLGSDPLRVQGPGGNTSIKADGIMWIKASGTELANANDQPIFVAVDRVAAQAEAEGQGDGSCKATVLDPTNPLRPSIETTFHAALDWSVVAHTHSIATLVHAVSPEGRAVLDDKLAGLPFVRVPYAKPGLPLTKEILTRISPATQVIVLENHGLICCGPTVGTVADLMDDVEARLEIAASEIPAFQPATPAPDGFDWARESWLATNERLCSLALAGSYYPDHVVFLGPALPQQNGQANPPAILKAGEGILLRQDATPSQRAMLTCLADVLCRLPGDWTAEPIGPKAEAELLNWDAEKYRQALAEQP